MSVGVDPNRGSSHECESTFSRPTYLQVYAAISMLRFGLADSRIGFFGNRLDRLVDGPSALWRLIGVARVERRVHYAHRVSPPFGGQQLESEATMGAVVANPLLVPGPVMFRFGHSEVERWLRSRPGTFNRVAALGAAP